MCTEKKGFQQELLPKLFPARQTLEASEAVARSHKLSQERTVFAQQQALAIDAGIFHNDVIGVGNQNVYFCHEKSFEDMSRVEKEVGLKFSVISKKELFFIIVRESEVKLSDAVKSYLFNSQLVSTAKGMVLIAPLECQEIPSVRAYLEKLIALKTPIAEVKFLNLRQSMQNGGGPACLRFRVALNMKEFQAVHQKVILTNHLFQKLNGWVSKHYRDTLTEEDLKDPDLLKESRRALEELTHVLGLGSLYEFQS